MTNRLSTGARNGMVGPLGLSGMLDQCVVSIYSGSQPANADAATTGTLLGIVTLGSSAYTAETQATGTITITGSSGSITALLVGGFNIIGDTAAVLYNTSTTQTASDLTNAINRNGVYQATFSGAVVTIKPRPGVGASHNGYAVTSTATLTATYTNMSGGVASVNGLAFGPPVGGVLSKPAGQVWGFTGIAAGTAGWYRITASVADAGALLTAAPWLVRMDGAIATTGAEMSLSNISIAVNAPNTIDSFSFTMPAQ